MKTFRPSVEILETRCTPAVVYPTPPPGYQIVVVADILDNAPLFPGQHGFTKTPAEQRPSDPFVNVGALIRQYPIAGYTYTNGQSPYWFVPNEALPAGWTPGPPAAPQQAAVKSSAPIQHVGQAFVGDLAWMVGASLVHRPEVCA